MMSETHKLHDRFFTVFVFISSKKFDDIFAVDFHYANSPKYSLLQLQFYFFALRCYSNCHFAKLRSKLLSFFKFLTPETSTYLKHRYLPHFLDFVSHFIS